uniref:spondin domain-containing protein n=1 Tax=Thaumasiovibrio occultus TaxID=1891184 RepID=UPI0018655386|nr:spondin domain-containing protein [Thaumasiovibrio occultus]
MKMTLLATCCTLGLTSLTPAFAANVDISITNLSRGIYFTPLLLVAHDDSADLFEAGSAASPELESMAEGGDISGLASLAGNVGAVVNENPAGGILNPGDTATTTMDTGDLNLLTVTAMLLPTNDGFVGLDSWQIPDEPGTYTVYLNGYDAGTEANDELAPSMPNPPFITFGSGGSGVETTSSNATVHIHPGNLGDSDASGGASDLDNAVHRWLNPVAKMTITVN